MDNLFFKSKEEYEKGLVMLDNLMEKGENNLSNQEILLLELLASELEKYEEEHFIVNERTETR